MDFNELRFLFLSSVFFGLSFPPFPFGFLAPVGLVIFLYLIEKKSASACFRLGYLLGLFWGAITLFWIGASTLTGAVFAITINALHYAIVWYLYAILRKRSEFIALSSLPFLWVAAEYLRNFSDLRFNWMVIGNTQTYYNSIIQIADITGPLGISFVIVVIAVLIYLTLKIKNNKRFTTAGSGILVILILVVYGEFRIKEYHSADRQLIKTALVQPNVDPFQKWESEFQQEAFNMLMESSWKLAGQKPDIIVWPETATPFFLRRRQPALNRIYNFLDSTDISLLTGTPDYEYFPDLKEYHSHNAAFFFRPGVRAFESYFKIALVPAAESMPFKEELPMLRNLNVGGGDFFPGKEFTVFQFPSGDVTGRFSNNQYQVSRVDSAKEVTVKLSPIICYESVFSHIVKKFIENGANILTIITNDGWFGITSGPYQHAQYAKLRAIENRISIIRCANTGISGFIDPTGNYLKTASLGTKADITCWLPLRSDTTFYSTHGDWIGKITLLVSLLIIFINFIVLKFFKLSEDKNKIK